MNLKRKAIITISIILVMSSIVACSNNKVAETPTNEVATNTNEKETPTEVIDTTSREYYLSIAETSADNFEYEEHGEEITITKCLVEDNENTVIVIPSKINNKNVVALEAELFANNNYKAVVLNKGLKVIGDSCFMNSKIDDIIIQDGVEEIHNKAFYLSNISKIELPNTVKHIYSSSFALCVITEINIPASVELLESGSFSLCSSLEVITFEGNPVIEKGAFAMCDKINKIVCNNGDIQFEDEEFSSMSVDAQDITFIVPDNSKIKDYVEKQEFTYEVMK